MTLPKTQAEPPGHQAPPAGAAQFLAGARLLLGGVFVAGQGVLVQAGRIAAILPDTATPPANRITLPQGSLLAPGLIDVQVNGGGGILFNDSPNAGAARAIAAAHRGLGTSAVLPTLITDTDEKMAAAGQALASPIPGVLGLHLEGPWLGAQKPGVHPPNLIRAPSPADIDRAVALSAGIAGKLLITLAPETVSPADIARLAAAGIIVAAGHSAATADQTTAALTAGVTGFTHMFNAMGAITARNPGIATVALTDPHSFCGVIVDGVHVAPALLRLLLAAKPHRRIMLVSDSMSCAGTEMTEFTLGGHRILRKQACLTTQDGILAGADISLLDAVRHAVRLLGLTPAAALTMASQVPAAFLGISAERGSLGVGAIADVLVLDQNLSLLAQFYDGVLHCT